MKVLFARLSLRSDYRIRFFFILGALRILKDELEKIEGFTIKTSEYIKAILKDYKFYAASYTQANISKETESVKESNLKKEFIDLSNSSLEELISSIKHNHLASYILNKNIDARKVLGIIHQLKLKLKLSIENGNYYVIPV